MSNLGSVSNPPLPTDPIRAARVCRLNALGWLIEEAKLLGRDASALIAESERVAAAIDDRQPPQQD